MDELIVTFGVLMGMEVDNVQDRSAGDSGSNVLQIFCPTAESEEGKIDITPRMLDLELTGMRPVAIARWNPRETRCYMIFAKEGLSEAMQNAVLDEAGSVVREALVGSDLLNYSSARDNN